VPTVRVAVVDLGTNSTRLLVADVTDGHVTELARDSRVTRLGQGVDATGELSGEAAERVFAVLRDYRSEIDRHGAEATTAVLTSAVRDAANGSAFAQRVRTEFRLDAHTITGDEEAQLTFLGATSERAPDRDATDIVVVDIGGGSTELVVGRRGDVTFHVSLQAGVVRMTERHLHDDPASPDQVAALTEEVRALIDAGVPGAVRARVGHVVAVAGTATSAAAMSLGLEPYDADVAHGHHVSERELERLLARLAQMDDEQRRAVPGLHPDRAPTIVAGMAMLLECVRAFGAAEMEASEHDILRGAALRLAERAP
jgi:exopolyphosphatase/guanosine-5'-triphosphate,3'-diphosphate pyrophosphatase